MKTSAAIASTSPALASNTIPRSDSVAWQRPPRYEIRAHTHSWEARRVFELATLAPDRGDAPPLRSWPILRPRATGEGSVDEPSEVQAVRKHDEPEEGNEDFVSGHGANVSVRCDRFDPRPALHLPDLTRRTVRVLPDGSARFVAVRGFPRWVG